METCLQGLRATLVVATITVSLGFKCHRRQDATSQGGGIWLFWKDNTIDVDIVYTTPQVVHVTVQVTPSLFGMIWLGPLPFWSMVIGPLPVQWENLTIADLINFEGNWDLSPLRYFLPQEILQTIKALPLSIITPIEDQPYWPNSNGHCLSISAYRSLIPII
ncbi:hypothetical protein ACH5RR_020887 [Cinchona calisaya]|uniref:Uncharacterized protein n=1 Tax=Cinchona calisaya TaxID=153742 RepID=A0ABD2ZKR5_9GENT